MDTLTIETLEEHLRQAMLAGDVATLDVLAADDLVFTSQSGELMDKYMDLAAHESGLLQLTTLEPSEQQIRQYGNTAIVTVRMELAGTYADQLFAGTFRYTRVWIKREDLWQIVAAHVSQLQ